MANRDYNRGYTSDRLRATNDVACENALNVLSILTHKGYEKTTPEMELIDFDEAIARIKEINRDMIGAVISASGDFEGAYMLLLNKKLAETLGRCLEIEEVGYTNGLSEELREVILEVGEISYGSCLTALSTYTGIDINTTSLNAAADTVEGLLNGGAFNCSQTDSDILNIRCMFTADENPELSGMILMLPEIASIERLIERIGAK